MTITQSDMQQSTSSAKDVIRASSPLLLKFLGWCGIFLSWGTTIARFIKADIYLRQPDPDYKYFAWYGFVSAMLFCLLISWGQWTWTPFGRRRRDLETQGYAPVFRWTMLTGYTDPQGAYRPVYSWRMFMGYLVVLFPDVFISLWEVSAAILMPFLSAAWQYGWVVLALGTLGIITALASIGPENVIFK